jgi:chromosome segregation ATPase
MASILSLRPRLFRTRNAARDANTDLDRLMTVKRSLEAAIEDASRERRGLQKRVDVYHAQASSMLDNSSEYGARHAEDEKVIRDAEDHAATASKRIKQIDDQIGRLNGMLQQIDAAVNGSAA